MKDTLPTLLHRPPPLLDESLPSFLIRLAQENFYHSPTMVIRLCQERLACPDNITRPTSTETYRLLSALTTTSADDLYAASVHRFASTLIPPPSYQSPSVRLPSGKTVPVLSRFLLGQHLWPQTDVQFCPLCLQEALYHRLNWMPLAVAVCLHHQCLLVRGCPHCAKNISVADILKAQCPNCTLSLPDMSVNSVALDKFGLFSQTLLQASLGLCRPPPAKSHSSLPDMPPAVLYWALDGRCRDVIRVQNSCNYLYQSPCLIGVPLFPCLSKKDITPALAYILYATAFKSLLRWAQGGDDFLEFHKGHQG